MFNWKKICLRSFLDTLYPINKPATAVEIETKGKGIAVVADFPPKAVGFWPRGSFSTANANRLGSKIL